MDARFDGPLSDQLRFDQLVCSQGSERVTLLDPMREFQIELHGTALRQFPALELKLGLFRDGLHIASCHDTQCETAMRAGSFTSTFHIAGDVFRPGQYTIGLGASASTGSWTWGSEVAALDFVDNTAGRSAERSGGVIAIPYQAQRSQ